MENDGDFKEDTWWEKVKETAGSVPFVLDAVALYFAMIDPRTPLQARASIAAALGYFVLPVDVIPDAILVAGFTDDAGVITATLAYVGSHIKERHYRKARKFLNLPAESEGDDDDDVS